MIAQQRMLTLGGLALQPNQSSNIAFQISWTILRVVAGIVMVHNGLDKLANIESFAQAYVAYLGLPFPITLTVMAEVLQTLQASPDWADKLIDQPDILGVSQIDPQGILLQIRTQTAPGQQFSLLREYRLRLNQAFNAEGIRLALPQREVRYRGPDPST